MTDFSTAKAEDLRGDVKRTSEAEEQEKQALQLAKIHLDRVKADQSRMKWFYRIAISLLIATFLATTWGLYILIDRDKFESNVAIAFFTGVTAQVIGLAHIISRYFFPEGGGLTKLPAEK